MQRGADLTIGSGLGLEGGKLLGIGQFAFPQQIRHFLKAAILGQILHRIAAIGQAIRLRHHLGDGGDIGIDADQALIDFGFRGFVHRVSSLAKLALGRRTRRRPCLPQSTVQKMPGLLSSRPPAGSATFSALSSPAFSFVRSCTTSRKRLDSRAEMMPSVMVLNLRM